MPWAWASLRVGLRDPRAPEDNRYEQLKNGIYRDRGVENEAAGYDAGRILAGDGRVAGERGGDGSGVERRVSASLRAGRSGGEPGASRGPRLRDLALPRPARGDRPGG